MLSCFDTIPECDRRTDRHTQTHDDGIYRAIIELHGKNVYNYLLSKSNLRVSYLIGGRHARSTVAQTFIQPVTYLSIWHRLWESEPRPQVSWCPTLTDRFLHHSYINRNTNTKLNLQSAHEHTHPLDPVIKNLKKLNTITPHYRLVNWLVS